jgi:hypothetical protein
MIMFNYYYQARFLGAYFGLRVAYITTRFSSAKGKYSLMMTLRSLFSRAVEGYRRATASIDAVLAA